MVIARYTHTSTNIPKYKIRLLPEGLLVLPLLLLTLPPARAQQLLSSLLRAIVITYI